MRFKPYEIEAKDENEEGIVESTLRFVFLGVRLDHLLVNGFVKLPGLLVMQYLFFWNWKRVIDPDNRSVVLTGLMVTLGLAGIVVLLILREGS